MNAVQAFRDELLKCGAPAILETLGRTLGSSGTRSAVQRGLGGLGAGAGIGGLVGAGVGGVRGYRDARRQGADVGEALLGGVGGVASGAGKGALIGGLGAGAAEAAGLAPGLYGRAAKAPGMLGSAARFGQRQVHALTGWTPKGFMDPGGARQMGAGAANAVAQKGRATKELAQATKAVETAERAEQMGLTSIPGYIRSLGKNGLLPTVSAGAAEQWHGGGTAGKLMMAGLPAAAVAQELGNPAEGRGGRLLGAAGQAGAMALGPIPLAGQLAVGTAASRAARSVGRLRGHAENAAKPVLPEAVASANGLAVSPERVYSDRASNEIPAMTGAMQ
jgi:hypothetical protein